MFQKEVQPPSSEIVCSTILQTVYKYLPGYTVSYTKFACHK